MTGFGARLAAAVERHGRLCVGIDPHPYLLDAWGLPDSAAGLREFSLRVIDAATDAAAVVKPQVAFYERHGAAGYAVLEEALASARAAGLLVIADAKRGDVGTSVEAYGQAWLTPGSSLEADAMTVSAFQGLGSLQAVLEAARSAGKGLFVLAATSNSEAATIQRSVAASGRTVAATIADDVVAWNRSAPAETETPDASWGDVGLVLGATLALPDYGLEPAALVGTPVLAPGFGHQGARLDQVDALFGELAPSVLVSASRSILSAGPDGLRSAIAEHVSQISGLA